MYSSISLLLKLKYVLNLFSSASYRLVDEGRPYSISEGHNAFVGESNQMQCRSWKLNTSNHGKIEEFKRLFAKYGYTLETTHFDLKEIDSDPLEVVAHKASQLGENVIVEDTSLDIEGASVGVNIRWLLDHLTDYSGRKAKWTTLLGFRQGQQIYIYRGSTEGTIISPRGTEGFGFDRVFLPNGCTLTLAESKPDSVNARAKAVDSLLTGDVWTKHPMVEIWQGPWQNHPQ